MAVLPSGLETIAYGVQGWNAIVTANMELLDDRLVSVMTAVSKLGVATVNNPDALTSQTLTDSSGGTSSLTINQVSGSGADSSINNNLASLTTQINALRTDITSIRSILVSLLEASRKSTGNGVLGG